MGDVAMTVPLIRALSEQFPELKITIVTRAFFAPFFLGINNVEVYTADLKGKHKGVLGLYKLSKELRALKFDTVADLHNVLRSKILKFFFIGKKVVQLDKGRAEKKALTSGIVFQQLKTTHQRYADVFATLDYKVDLKQPKFPAKIQLTSKLNAFVSNLKLKTIGIAPFAAHQSKMYPLDKMKEVIAELSENYNVILFGGGTTEVELLSKIEEKFDTVNSVAGKLSLDEELALISNLDVMLSMDSGNGHLAAMLGIKVITIWGVTHPFAGFAPFNQPEEFALIADRTQYPLIPTSIYGNKYPEDYENAAGSISVGNVVSKVKKVIEA
ncbi:glycosyltransferase family 9 protein [Winogradskyella flava]|uniref:Glycosyltransferase family 9 protein n=1 Tax=Winogradskyella flava TaxID=1884876 RepID=A0A842INQ3_9FLAO|nr:glycosyltransferase family 9 protein [Winogradskyella flava]MBC2843839.1 glycosyltransferase family 9 protein [Winogradskyella flava]